MSRIYLSPPHVSEEERRLLLEAFDSNWIAPLGPHVDAFEQEFGEIVGVPYAAALSSGTAALHLGLLLLGVGPGDEVITSTLTFAATANAIVYRGARPVFIDSTLETWTMDPELLRAEMKACAARGKLPKAVLVVDLYGQCADYEPILAICAEYGVPVIEDAAEALGSSYRGRPAGTFGALAAFSFNGNKIITTGGGGMLVSPRSDWIERARYLSTQARDHAPHYQHSEVGYNYRMSNLLAAVGRGQLRSLAERIQKRRANNTYYRHALFNAPGVSFMPEAPYGRSNNWLTCILVDPHQFGATREEIRQHLESQNIESRPVWKPLHMQPAFSGCRARGGSVSQGLFERGLCLPSGSNLSHAELDRVCGALLAIPREKAGEAVPKTPKPVPSAKALPPPQPEAHFVPLKRTVLRFRRALSVVAQLAVVCLANVAAFGLRFDFVVPAWAQDSMWRMLPWLVVIRALVFIPFRVYEGLWRYTSFYDLQRIAAATLVSTVLFFFAVWSPWGVTAYPRSIFIVDALLLILGLGGLRSTRRLYYELQKPKASRRVLVVGAGGAGELVVRDMLQNHRHGLMPIGFIDDEPSMRGRSIHGVRVLGGRRELRKIMEEHKPDEVVVALPSASAGTIRAVLRDFEPYRVGLKTLPELRDVLSGRIGVREIRELRMEDLLQRAPVGLDPSPLRDLIAGRRILVTGAAGAAGAEIARQCASYLPERLILLDRADRGLKSTFDDVSVKSGGKTVAVLTDIADQKQVRRVILEHAPHLVFHAAVNNDVDLMEAHPAEAVRTNILGTRYVVEACRDAGVERLVLLSTTRAVQPNTVVGATRRVSELIVEACGQDPAAGSTLMCGVRLSSILGRPGSLVPTLRQQIRAGGPVTVTHPEVKRYFLLAREAVQLVLHAAAAAESGTLYVLDMGEQMRVLDVARDVIRLEGFIPDEEITIQFTGLGPTERLYEELANPDESVAPSPVERIMRVRSNRMPQSSEQVLQGVDLLAAAVENGEPERLLTLLRTLVPGFTPQGTSATIRPFSQRADDVRVATAG